MAAATPYLGTLAWVLPSGRADSAAAHAYPPALGIGAQRQRLPTTHGACAGADESAITLVVSDLVGETGLRILEAILQGERDPEVLVPLRDSL